MFVQTCLLGEFTAVHRLDLSRSKFHSKGERSIANFVVWISLFFPLYGQHVFLDKFCWSCAWNVVKHLSQVKDRLLFFKTIVVVFVPGMDPA
jgi:hypothetical protein